MGRHAAENTRGKTSRVWSRTDWCRANGMGLRGRYRQVIDQKELLCQGGNRIDLQVTFSILLLRFVYSYTWSIYAEVFRHMWAASAFKGRFTTRPFEKSLKN